MCIWREVKKSSAEDVEETTEDCEHAEDVEETAEDSEHATADD